MRALIDYIRRRYRSKSLGFGPPWFRPLWLDAMVFGFARFCTLHWPPFRQWCLRVDQIFYETYEWPRSYTQDAGLDCWIDVYWNGDSPQEAVDEEVLHWD